MASSRHVRRWRAARTSSRCSSSGIDVPQSAGAGRISIQRPILTAGNIDAIVAKRLQLLSEVVPQHSRVAVLWHPHAYGDRTMAGMLKEAEHAAEILGMQLQFVAAAGADDIEGAFSLMTRGRADALSVFPSPILFAEYGRIASIAADKKLPAIYAAREGVEAGGLMSYGANLPDLARQQAADKGQRESLARPGRRGRRARKFCELMKLMFL
jgi:hypothetical protein